MTECPNCGGEGVIDGLIVGDDIVTETCRRCRGTGLVQDGPTLFDADAAYVCLLAALMYGIVR